MERDARVAIKKECIIGTSANDAVNAGGGLSSSTPSGEPAAAPCMDQLSPEQGGDACVRHVLPPPIADVIHAASRLASLVLSDPDLPQSFSLKPLPADALDRVVDICEVLEQMYSWAVEEGTTFVTEPSQLAEAEAPHGLVACLSSPRPRVLAAALRVVRHALCHPQSRSELLREAALKHVGGVACEAMDRAARDRLAVTILMTDLGAALGRYGGVVEVVLAVLAVATELAPWPGAVSAALRHGLVSEVLRLAQSLPHQSVDMVVAIADFFAALTEVPLCETDETGESVVSTAVVVAHVGVILPTLVQLFQQAGGGQHLMVKRAVCRVFLHCARHVENRARLLEVGAYGVVVSCLRSAVRVPDLFVSCAETVGYCIALLDALQTRQLLRVLRDLLLQVGEVELQVLVLALLLSIIRSVGAESGPAAMATSAYAAYQLYPMPPTTTDPADTRTTSAEAHGTKTDPIVVRLVQSSLLSSPAKKAADVMETVRALSIPQLVAHVTDFYLAHDGSEIDAHEALAVSNLLRLADQCLALLSRPF